jgi:hypothetical protein
MTPAEPGKPSVMAARRRRLTFRTPSEGVPVVQSPGKRGDERWNTEQFVLAVLGPVVFILGTTVHRDRPNLAVVLVVLGVVMLVLATLLPRLKSLSANVPGIGQISLDLSPTTSAVSDQALKDPTGAKPDLRGADPYNSNSPAFEQAVTGGPATYVLINLEEGESWLTSRLYLFVDVLAEVRDIRAVVFTTRVDAANVFAGLSSVDCVLRRLGWAFPWLPMKLGEAWSQLRHGDGHRPAARRMSGKYAAELYSTYVRSLQLWTEDLEALPVSSAGSPTAPPAGAQAYPPMDPPRLDPHLATPVGTPEPPQEWQKIGDTGDIWEHANWLDAAFVKELMGDALSTQSVSNADKAELARVLTGSNAQYIAVLDDREQVQSLIDRSKLVIQAIAVRPGT